MKKEGGEDGMVVQKPEEDPKSLIIHTQGPVEGTPEKLVVDIETLSFRPAAGQQLQTARRGKPFKPGNLRGRGGGRGVMRYKPTVKDSSLDADNILVKGDDGITVEKTTYNEGLAVQGLVGLSEDQPSEGEICKLHDKGDKSESDYDKKIEAETEVATKENVKDDSNNEKVEKDKGTPVKCKEIMKRQTFVKTKMKLMKARQIILKRNRKGNVKVQSVPQKEQKQSEGGDESDLSEMSSLHMQVETMIKQGKTDVDSIRKINKLKGILAMLGKPEDKHKTDEKHKTKRKSSETDKDLKYDEQISSDLNNGEQISSDLKPDEQVSSDLKQDEKLSSDLTQDEKISGEDIKTENVILKIQVEEPYSSDESTNALTVKEKTNTLNENVKFEKQKRNLVLQKHQVALKQWLSWMNHYMIQIQMIQAVWIN